MIIRIGTKNQNKIEGVRRAFAHYYKPEELTLISVPITIEEFGHPRSLEETVDGALQRAKKAFGTCDYSVGIESGLIEVPHTKTGYMETVICALNDGRNISLGLAPAFEWPPRVTQMILEQCLDGSQAMREAGVTHHEKIGAIDGGALGLLTKGATDRTQQVELAVLMALVHVVNQKLYQTS